MQDFLTWYESKLPFPEDNYYPLVILQILGLSASAPNPLLNMGSIETSYFGVIQIFITYSNIFSAVLPMVIMWPKFKGQRY